jgi:hypothetical protein
VVQVTKPFPAARKVLYDHEAEQASVVEDIGEQATEEEFVRSHVRILKREPGQPGLSEQERQEEEEMQEALRLDGLTSTPTIRSAELVKIEEEVRSDVAFMEQYKQQLDVVRTLQASLRLEVAKDLRSFFKPGTVTKLALASLAGVKGSKAAFHATQKMAHAGAKTLSYFDSHIPSATTTTVVATTLIGGGVTLGVSLGGAALAVSPVFGPIAPAVIAAGGVAAAGATSLISGTGVLMAGARLGYGVIRSVAHAGYFTVSIASDVAEAGLIMSAVSAQLVQTVAAQYDKKSVNLAELEVTRAMLESRALEIQVAAQNHFELEVTRRQLTTVLKSNRYIMRAE